MDVTGLPQGQIIVGQPNRVAEPAQPTFIVMMPLRFERIATNFDGYQDSSFVGSVANNVLTVTELLIGIVPTGALLFGQNINSSITIQQQLSGQPGQAGTYQLSQALNLAQQNFAAGGKVVEIDADVTVQLDFHSADNSAAQLAQTVSALLRDIYGVSFFAALTAPQNAVVPLFADDPALRPFVNAEGNYEWRWVLDAHFQVNQVTRVPQQFADAVSIVTVAVPQQVTGL
ncbi:hypothetical protein H8A95_15995 [Bradyrhizobium sp. Pear76]|uniref:phage neck terminator protein n=1 Tax=Bradyrhizobium oropedii TaxID=1571201 RepID=UPI001E43A62D|nr:hypothetical protein [Bradyrhizobium oropedii]MCC8963773.1 hypothetical protein [Bradyrhizobium oropedii]